MNGQQWTALGKAVADSADALAGLRAAVTDGTRAVCGGGRRMRE